jgi:WD40 repeat protein
VKIQKPRLTFKLARSSISCQDWSGYLRLACGGRDGSITIWDIEKSFVQQRPIIHVKIDDNNGISTVNSISWHSILDGTMFISTNDKTMMNIHDLKDPYVSKNISRMGREYEMKQRSQVVHIIYISNVI